MVRAVLELVFYHSLVIKGGRSILICIGTEKTCLFILATKMSHKDDVSLIEILSSQPPVLLETNTTLMRNRLPMVLPQTTPVKCNHNGNIFRSNCSQSYWVRKYFLCLMEEGHLREPYAHFTHCKIISSVYSPSKTLHVYSITVVSYENVLKGYFNSILTSLLISSAPVDILCSLPTAYTRPGFLLISETQPWSYALLVPPTCPKKRWWNWKKVCVYLL